MADLKARGQRIAEQADRLSRAFAVELARIFRDNERALQPILRRALDGDRVDQIRGARGLLLRRQIRAALEEAGFDRYIDAATSHAVETMAETVLASRVGQGAGRLLAPDPRRLRALIDIGRTNLLQVGDDTAAAIWRSTASWVFSARPTNDILDDLFNALDEDMGALHTLFDTQVSTFARQVEAIATADLPADQPFLYVGPSDQRNRPFCKEHVGQVLTRDRIEQLDNGQLPNPFITAGGYNCRHSWLAVESQELRELVNTGRRAPEFAGASL